MVGRPIFVPRVRRAINAKPTRKNEVDAIDHAVLCATLERRERDPQVVLFGSERRRQRSGVVFLREAVDETWAVYVEHFCLDGEGVTF